MTTNTREGEHMLRYLRFKNDAAAELYHDGRISRAEMFRHELDLSLGCDSGPIVICNPGCTRHDHQTGPAQAVARSMGCSEDGE